VYLFKRDDSPREFDAALLRFSDLQKEACNEFGVLHVEAVWVRRLYNLFPQYGATLHYDADDFLTPRLQPGEVVELVWLPFNVFLTSAKAIELLIEGEGCDSSDNPVPSDPHVHVDHGHSKISVDGQEHDAELRWCSIVQALIDAEGTHVTGPQMGKLRGCRGMKPWKEIKALEKAIPGIEPYLLHEGNKGYRLLNG